MNKTIVIPVLNTEYKVVFTYGTPEEIKRVLKRYYYPMEKILSDHFDGRGVCFHWPGVHPVIAMPQIPKTSDQIGTLAHEAIHAIDDIFEKIGETGSREVYAHCVRAVVTGVLDYYRSKKC
ncbi:MAG: hypothetical protein WDA59_05450 [Methanofastidiosum sp.]